MIYVNILTYISRALFIQTNQELQSIFIFNFLIWSSSWEPVSRALKYPLILRIIILYFQGRPQVSVLLTFNSWRRECHGNRGLTECFPQRQSLHKGLSKIKTIPRTGTMIMALTLSWIWLIYDPFTTSLKPLQSSSLLYHRSLEGYCQKRPWKSSSLTPFYKSRTLR